MQVIITHFVLIVLVSISYRKQTRQQNRMQLDEQSLNKTTIISMHLIRPLRLPTDLLILWVIYWMDRHANTWTVRFYHGHFYEANMESSHCWTLRELAVALHFPWPLPLIQDFEESYIIQARDVPHFNWSAALRRSSWTCHSENVFSQRLVGHIGSWSSWNGTSNLVPTGPPLRVSNALSYSLVVLRYDPVVHS